MRIQLGPTESCRIRDMSKPLVQITRVHAPLLQNGSPAAAGQLAGSHVACWLAASGSSLCPCEQNIITNPRFRERFYYAFYGKKCQSHILPSRSASEFFFHPTLILECSKADVWRRNKQFEPFSCPYVLFHNTRLFLCTCMWEKENNPVVFIHGMDKYLYGLYKKLFAWDSAW